MATEFDALLNIINSDAEELAIIDSKHELLRFLDPVLGKADWQEELHAEFLERFDPDEKLSVVKIRVAYSVEIRRALGRIPAEDESALQSERTV